MEYIRYRPIDIKPFFGNVVEARAVWAKIERQITCSFKETGYRT